MRITPQWLSTTPAAAIVEALQDEGFDAVFVGGCVRDSLMGLTPKDIDIATSATPTEVAMVFEPLGMAVHPTGIAHGTVTVINGGEAFEVTTFRKDVSTDGRNATVAFTRSVDEDAMRRDFTMNAIYMDQKGVIYDITGQGVDDIMHRRIRFVGDATTRCREDYLRIMRYFRFYARFGAGGTPDPEALRAVGEHWYSVFSHVSGERVWDETKKILSLPDPVPALVMMDQLHINRELFHKQVNDPWWLYALIRAEKAVQVAPDWHRRYVMLAGDMKPTYPISRAEGNRLRQTASNMRYGDSPALVAFQYRDADIARDTHLLHCAGLFGQPMARIELEAEITRGIEAQLPVDGADFFAQGVGPGPAMGSALHFAREAFKASDLKAGKNALISYAMGKLKTHAV